MYFAQLPAVRTICPATPDRTYTEKIHHPFLFRTFPQNLPDPASNKSAEKATETTPFSYNSVKNIRTPI